MQSIDNGSSKTFFRSLEKVFFYCSSLKFPYWVAKRTFQAFTSVARHAYAVKNGLQLGLKKQVFLPLSAGRSPAAENIEQLHGTSIDYRPIQYSRTCLWMLWLAEYGQDDAYHARHKDQFGGARKFLFHVLGE